MDSENNGQLTFWSLFCVCEQPQPWRQPTWPWRISCTVRRKTCSSCSRTTPTRWRGCTQRSAGCSSSAQVSAVLTPPCNVRTPKNRWNAREKNSKKIQAGLPQSEKSYLLYNTNTEKQYSHDEKAFLLWKKSTGQCWYRYQPISYVQICRYYFI